MKSNFLQRPLIKWFILVFLFISAFGIRLHHIAMPPLDFSSVRQYQAAHNARAYYFNTLKSVSEERRKIAEINMNRIEFKLEPRIMERLAVFGYQIVGEETLWIPRVLSSIFWIVGGIFLFLIAEKLSSFNGALFSAAFFLFMPYSILASRSFQPDPLMLMTLVISIYAILSYHEQPSKSRFLPAIIASALAMFIKPYCIFLIFGVFLSPAIKMGGIRKTIFSKHVILFSAISIMPAFLYYSYGTFVQGGDAQLHAQITFLPHLYLHAYFWKDWLVMIGQVTGYIAFVSALIGLFLSRGLLRVVLTGLWGGYLLFGLIFTYHIHTHSYYQLQLIPVVALSLIPVAVGIKERFSSLLSSKKHIYYLVGLLVLTALCLRYIIRSAPLQDYKSYLRPVGAIVGLNTEFYLFLTGDFEKEISAFREIGELVNHGTNNVFLTYDFGRALTYHGEFAGLPWPTEFSMQSRKEMGVPVPDKEEIFNSRYLLIRTHKSSLFNTKTVYGDYIQYTPDYFIITAFKEFDKQPDLRKFLYYNFPVLAQTEDYLIFDLRKMSE